MRSGAGWVVGAAVVLAGAGLYACACNVALTWDGSYQLCRTLVTGHAYYYPPRFHSWIVWQPVLWAARFTSDVHVLQMIYGAPFLLAPAVALLLSWWIVRREAPNLILWATFGIAAGPLPGQIFAINDTIFQQHLFWPVFLGMLVRLTPAQRIVLTLLALLQLSQPIGIVLCFGAAGAAALIALADRTLGRRQSVRVALMLLLVGIGVWKLFAFPDIQAKTEASLHEVLKRFQMGVSGLPLYGLLFIWTAAALAFAPVWRPAWRRSVRTGAFVLAIVCIVAAGAVWSTWAIDPAAWQYALDYRRWVTPLSVPFFVLAVVELMLQSRRRLSTQPVPATDNVGAARRASRPRLGDRSGVLAGALTLVFAVVLGLQSAIWALMTQQLMADVNAYPGALVPISATPMIERTALDHWSLPALVCALQGKRQQTVLLFDESWLLDEEGRSILDVNPPEVPITPPQWHHWRIEPGPGGWYDFGPFIERLHAPLACDASAFGNND